MAHSQSYWLDYTRGFNILLSVHSWQFTPRRGKEEGCEATSSTVNYKVLRVQSFAIQISSALEGGVSGANRLE